MTSSLGQANAPIRKVTIVGGTHGNEVTGVHCIRHWQSHPDAILRPNFKTQTIIGNPTAVRENKRYLDKDLNRCFSPAVQQNTDLSSLKEVKRAAEITANLQDPNDPTDFVIDLHTTTTNMGVTLIFEQANWLTYTILTQVAGKVDDVHFLYEPASDQSHYLISSAPQGIMIEVGPIAQSLMHAQRFQQTTQAVHAALDAIVHYNQLTEDALAALSEKDLSLPVYHVFDLVPFPTDAAGLPIAMVHPVLQDRDYQPLEPGSPEFLFRTGEEKMYSGPACFPVFVNEAAYYDNAMAYSRANRIVLDFNSSPM